MDLTSKFPRPVVYDRIICTNSNIKDFFGEGGVLVYASPNDRMTSHIIFDKNPRAEATLFASDFIAERYAKEVDFADLKVNYVKPAPVETPFVRTEYVKAEPKRRGRPAKVRDEAAAIVKAPSSGRRGRAKTTAVFTPELGQQALEAFKTSGKGMVETAKDFNISPAELSAYFKSQGIVLQRGKRSAA
jgi:hypothetical protein